MATALAAGWYADPADSSRYRYWTGDQWTTHVRDRGAVDIAAAAAARPLPDFDTPEGTAPEPAAGRGRRRVTVLGSVLALTVVAVTAGAVTFGGSEQSPAAGATLTGEVRVAAAQTKGAVDETTFVTDGTRCGTGAPPGIGAGTAVTVSNARGDELGRTVLHAGRVDRTLNSTTCVFAFEIGAVAGADVYTVQVADRAAIRMTSAQLQGTGWRIDLRVD